MGFEIYKAENNTTRCFLSRCDGYDGGYWDLLLVGITGKLREKPDKVSNELWDEILTTMLL